MEHDGSFAVALKAALSRDVRSISAIAAQAHIASCSLYRYARGTHDLTVRVASAVADVVMPDYGRSRFMNEEETLDRLEHMFKHSGAIQIVGNETIASDAIDAAVTAGASYQRVISGEHFRGALTDHLQSVATSPNVKIYQTPVSNYPSMIVGDEGSFTLLPNADGLFGAFTPTTRVRRRISRISRSSG